MLRIWILMTVIASVYGDTNSTLTQPPPTPADLPDKCQPTANSTLDECLERFANKWDEIRREKPHVDALVFPIMAMTPDDLKPLCSRIEEAQTSCGPAISTCPNHEITKFLQKNFIYGCREKQAQSLFAEQAECLLGVTAGQQQCLMMLKKSESDQVDQCGQVEQFFKCIHEEVYGSCKAKGLAALVHAIDRFGCDIKKLDASVGKPKAGPTCGTDEWQAVAQCFQPLLSLWSQIRDNDTSYLDTAFPIFKFDRSDLTKMCDIVRVIRDRCFAQINRCPGHQLPEFANAILGLACGTQQSAFFLNYECIRGVIAENDQCHPYTVGAWQPGHLKEICGRMPHYYKCLERPVTSKCGNDAINVLAQAIRQYGCDLNTDLAESRRPLAIPETTSASVFVSPTTPLPPPVQPSLLDFNASPPSHTALPPAPPALGPPGFVDSAPQTSFFLSQPIPPAPVVQGALETFFQNPADLAPKTAVKPAPPAAVLLEPQQALAPAPNLPLPDTFRMEKTTAPAPTTTEVSSGSGSTSTAASTSTATSALPLTTSSSSGSGSASSASRSAPARGVVAPIPSDSKVLDRCNLEKRNQLRECLNPLFRRWVEVHGKMMGDSHSNLTFPIYHYSKYEVVDLCDQYASAFLRCPFSIFQECLNDDVVYLANAIFGYVCAPQNMGDFARYFDCISTLVRQRTQCTHGVEGALLSVAAQSSSNRCKGAKDFYSCNKDSVEQSCTSEAQKIFAETVKQFGCDL